MGHDDRRGAGNRDEADLEVLLLQRTTLGEGFTGDAEGQDRGDRRQRRRGTDGLQKQAALGVDREDGAQHGRVDHAIPALFLASRYSHRGEPLMVGLGMIAATGAALGQQGLGIEWVLEK